jgi:hypothetical protein
VGISNIFAPPTAVFATTIPFTLLGSTTYPMLAGSNPKLFRVSRKKFQVERQLMNIYRKVWWKIQKESKYLLNLKYCMEMEE